MTTISLKLPEALVARLEAEARSRQKSKSAIIREYLEQGLNGAQRGKHLGTEIGQCLRRPRAGQNPAHVEHAEAGEGGGHGRFRSFALFSTVTKNIINGCASKPSN